MKKSGFTDFTEGSIPKHLMAFAVPMLLGNVFQALYSTVDSFWVGRYVGANALAAVSVSFPITFILISLVMGITMATTVLVSQYYGARDEDTVKRVVNNSIAMLGIGAVAVTILGLALQDQVLRWINTPAELMPLASGYLRIILAGLIFTFGYNVFGAILRGLGDSRTPLLFLVYATVTNIILDPLMIIGVGPFPRMGVAGAAWATIISQALSTVLAIAHLNKHNHLIRVDWRQFKFDRRLIALTIKIGLPAGIQQTLVSLGATVVMSIINTFGATAVAAFGAGSRLDQFANMPAMSIGLAVSALVGQNLGAGKDERVKEIVKWGSLTAGGMALCVALIAYFVPTILIVLFTSDPAVIAAGAQYLRIIAFSYIPFAIMFTTTGVMRGAGDTIPAMIFSLISLWVVRVPLAMWLSRLRANIDGVWLAMVASAVIGLAMSYGYYLTGRWRRAAVVRRRREGPQVDVLADE